MQLLLLKFGLVLTGISVVLSAGQSCPETTPKSSPYACTCTGDVMDCSNRGLTSVPTFTNDQTITVLKLQHNDIENITDGVFRNLHNISKLYLEDNNITHVSPTAFFGLESTLLHLDLSTNNLEVFPKAIGALMKVDWVDVSHNKIDEDKFDEMTMMRIGDTLTRFEFGSDEVQAWPVTLRNLQALEFLNPYSDLKCYKDNFPYFQRFEFGSDEVEAWPVTLRHLQALEFLNVTGGSYYTLPPNAFHGFEGTLRTLSMQHTNLIALPLALARLRYLDMLYFDHNHAIGDAGILIPSFGQTLLNNLRYISLVDDNLRTFPSILQFLRNVETLVLDSNRLAFVSDSSVQVAVGTKVQNISLANCSLSRVPGALSKLTNLTRLDISKNNIHSFENSDFDNMAHLSQLHVSQNPLEYIANETFKDLAVLEFLDLSDTRVQTIPEAIRFLKNLHELKLPTNAIECTCNIVWLKQFMEKCNQHLQIDGSCETIESTIREYLDKHIIYCPNYHGNATCV